MYWITDQKNVMQYHSKAIYSTCVKSESKEAHTARFHQKLNSKTSDVFQKPQHAINVHDHPWSWPVLNFQSTDVNGFRFYLKEKGLEMRPAGSTLLLYHRFVSRSLWNFLGIPSFAELEKIEPRDARAISQRVCASLGQLDYYETDFIGARNVAQLKQMESLQLLLLPF